MLETLPNQSEEPHSFRGGSVREETITEVKGEMDNALKFLYPDLDKIEGIDTDNKDPETDANEPVTLEDVNVDDVVNDLEHPEVVPGQVDENGNPIEEVFRLKQQAGIAEQFKDYPWSKSWIIENLEEK